MHSPDYRYICIGVPTTTGSSTASSSTSEGSYQVIGYIKLLLAGPDAVQRSPQAEEVLEPIGLTISQVVGVPARYVSVWFAESRRLKAATRQLSGSDVEVGFSIDVPADSAADVPDAGAVEASVDSVDVNALTSLLQENIDSHVGEGLYSVQVTVLGVKSDDAGSFVPDGSDDAGSSPSSPIVFFLAAVFFCIAFQFPFVALFWRLRRLRLQHEESNPARSGRAPLSPEAPGPTPEEYDQAKSGHAKCGGVLNWTPLPEAPRPPPGGEAFMGWPFVPHIPPVATMHPSNTCQLMV
jgi:hypothetical protein